MGRKKIDIKPLSDKRSRKDTFTKRKVGLIKKAAELSMLCNIKMLVAFEDLTGEVIKYSSHGIFDPVQYFSEKFLNSRIELTRKDYPEFFRSSPKKKPKQSKVNRETDDISEEDAYVEDDEDEVLEIEQQETSEANGNTITKHNSQGSANSMAVSLPTQKETTLKNKSNKTKTRPTNFLYQQMQQHMLQKAEHNYLKPPTQDLMQGSTVNIIPPTDQQYGNTNQFQSFTQNMNGQYQNQDPQVYPRWLPVPIPQNALLETIEKNNHLGARLEDSNNERPAEDKNKKQRTSLPRIKISEDVMEEPKKVINFQNTLLPPPNLFTASPIPYVGISPLQMAHNNTIYQFQEPISTKEKHSNFQSRLQQNYGRAMTPGQMQKLCNHQTESHKMPQSVGNLQENSIPQQNSKFMDDLPFIEYNQHLDIEEEQLLNKTGKQIGSLAAFEDDFGIESGINGQQDHVVENKVELQKRFLNDREFNQQYNLNYHEGLIRGPYEASYEISQKGRNNMYFRYPMVRSGEGERIFKGQSNLGSMDIQPYAKRPKDDLRDGSRHDQNYSKGELDNSGMRLYSPLPVTLGGNANSADWLQYFYFKQTDRTFQDEGPSFLNHSRGSGGTGGGELSLSIAKSPKPLKKIKEN